MRYGGRGDSNEPLERTGHSGLGVDVSASLLVCLLDPQVRMGLGLSVCLSGVCLCVNVTISLIKLLWSRDHDS